MVFQLILLRYNLSKNKYDRPYDRYINIWVDHHGIYSKSERSYWIFLGNDSSKLEVILSQMVQLLKGGWALQNE